MNHKSIYQDFLTWYENQCVQVLERIQSYSQPTETSKLNDSEFLRYCQNKWDRDYYTSWLQLKSELENDEFICIDEDVIERPK